MTLLCYYFLAEICLCLCYMCMLASIFQIDDELGKHVSLNIAASNCLDFFEVASFSLRSGSVHLA